MVFLANCSSRASTVPVTDSSVVSGLAMSSRPILGEFVNTGWMDCVCVKNYKYEHMHFIAFTFIFVLDLCPSMVLKLHTF